MMSIGKCILNIHGAMFQRIFPRHGDELEEPLTSTLQNLGTSYLEPFLAFKSKNGMYLDVPARKLGSMVWINGLFHLLIHGVFLMGFTSTSNDTFKWGELAGVMDFWYKDGWLWLLNLYDFVILSGW